MIIVNSTVLIALGNIGRLDLLPECIIPEKVREEVTKEPARSAIGKIRIFTPSDRSRRMALEVLGDDEETGDSDVVAALLDLDHAVATDDRRLRNVCRALGGRVTGTLGILIHSVREGKVTRDEALKILKQLDTTGFMMSVELYDKVREILESV